MSLKYGFRPLDVHTSLAVHPPVPCVTARRRVPTPPPAEAVEIRTPPSAVSVGCRLAKPFHAWFQSTLPSAGATLVTPPPLNSKTCVTPPMVARCGEL